MELERRELLKHVGALPVFAGIGQSSTTEPNWNMPFADAQNTGYAPYRPARGGLGVAWRASFDAVAIAGYTTYGSTAYVGLEDGRIVEIDTVTGEVQPLATLGARPGWSITTGSERLYLTTFDDVAYAVDRGTGKIHWQQPVSDTQGSPPTLHGGDVFIGRNDGTLYAFDANSGASVWKATLPGKIVLPPSVTDDLVVANETGGVTIAFDRDSGDERWRFDTEAATFPYTFGSPVVSNGRVFLECDVPGEPVNTDRQIVALSLDDGEELWRARRLMAPLVYLIARPEAIVFSSRRDLRAVDPATGDELWARSHSGRETHLASVEDAIYAVDDKVRVIDPASGNVRTRYSPSVAGDSDRLALRAPIPGGMLLWTPHEILAVTGAAANHRDGIPWKLLGGAGVAGLLGSGALWRHRQKQSADAEPAPPNDAN